MSSPDEKKLPFPPAGPESAERLPAETQLEPPAVAESESAEIVESTDAVEPAIADGSEVAVQPAAAEAATEPRAKFCPECGTATNGAKFCPECGASTGIATAAGTAMQPTSTPRPAAVVVEDEVEREVWRGSPDPLFSPVEAKTTTYTLTTERLRVDSGLVGKRHSQMELFRVKDVQVRRTLKHRARGRGDLVVLSTDPSSPRLKLEAIEDPEEVAETLRGLVKVARQRLGIVAREFM